MKFTKMSKEKRLHLILVLICTAAVLFALGFGLIKFQYENIRQIGVKRAEAEAKLKQMQDAIVRTDKIEVERKEAALVLAEREDQMASGDLYSWMINTIKGFKSSYKVEIPQFSQAIERPDLALLPDLPYKQVTLTLGGTAYYQDLGRFLADFENAFPQTRILNLDLGPASSVGAGEQEKLSFKMDIVALVKPDRS